MACAAEEEHMPGSALATKDHPVLKTGNKVTEGLAVMVLCVSGVFFCIAGISYAGMPPVNILRQVLAPNATGT